MIKIDNDNGNDKDYNKNGNDNGYNDNKYRV